MAVRERELAHDGIILEFEKRSGSRITTGRTARDRLSGYTLGKLLLRNRQTEGSGINQQQFHAGESYANLVAARRFMIDDAAQLQVKPQSLQLRSKGISREADPETVAAIRDQWASVEFQLSEVCKTHGHQVRRVTIGVCVERWPMGAVTELELRRLRMGLDAIWRAIT